ncbi:MAG: hypothetical protein M1484_04825 [Patescibacteria group bacterium]|nr:hypothetical protein [Patescibacteria group bacterium]MCL5432378.1 hypothetical protein [Patescibacteria group bacterium]
MTREIIDEYRLAIANVARGINSRAIPARVNYGGFTCDDATLYLLRDLRYPYPSDRLIVQAECHHSRILFYSRHGDRDFGKLDEQTLMGSGFELRDPII